MPSDLSPDVSPRGGLKSTSPTRRRAAAPATVPAAAGSLPFAIDEYGPGKTVPAAPVPALTAAPAAIVVGVPAPKVDLPGPTPAPYHPPAPAAECDAEGGGSDGDAAAAEADGTAAAAAPAAAAAAPAAAIIVSFRSSSASNDGWRMGRNERL